MKIYKNYIPTVSNMPMSIDLNGELLSIEEQKGRLVVYYNVDENITKKYAITLVETGKDVRVVGKYFKTLMLFGGEYVLHAFIEEVTTNE